MSSRRHLAFLLHIALCLALRGLPAQAGPPAVATVSEDGHRLPGRTNQAVMHPDFATRERWRQQHAALPQATFDARVKQHLAVAAQASVSTSMDLFADLTYDPAAWDQGGCGSCWVFASTAMIEVELSHHHGIKDFISTQYLQSNATNAGLDYACNGGSLSDAVAFYNAKKILVPWSNPHADYQDGASNTYCTNTLVNPALIGTAPNYAITRITPASIDNLTLNQTQMIAAIKAALNSGQAVGFSFYTNFDDATNGFYTVWDNDAETTLWVNPFEGGTWSDATWGGHMVPIMGYNEDDADPAKHYWIVRNEWGLPTNRPNGQLRLPMLMNYGATFVDSGHTYLCYGFETLTLTMTPPAAVAPTATIAALPARPLAGQALELKATITAGTPPFTYQWRKDANPIPGATSALYTLPYLTVADGNHSYDVVITNSALPAGFTSSPVTFIVSGSQLLANAGFEGGEDGHWTWTTTLLPTTQNPNRPNPFRTFAANAHSGSNYLFLGYWDSLDTGNTGTLEQAITLPSGNGTVTLGYWLRQITGQTANSALDTLSLRILSSSGSLLRNLKTHSNRDVDHLSWARETFDLSDLKGQTIKVRADWNEAAANLTAWRLDDLAVTYAAGTSPPPPPPTLDLNGDGSITPLDLLTLAKYWGTAQASCDLNVDGDVDGLDLALLLADL